MDMLVPVARHEWIIEAWRLCFRRRRACVADSELERSQRAERWIRDGPGGRSVKRGGVLPVTCRRGMPWTLGKEQAWHKRQRD